MNATDIMTIDDAIDFFNEEIAGAFNNVNGNGYIEKIHTED